MRNTIVTIMHKRKPVLACDFDSKNCQVYNKRLIPQQLQNKVQTGDCSVETLNAVYNWVKQHSFLDFDYYYVTCVGNRRKEA